MSVALCSILTVVSKALQANLRRPVLASTWTPCARAGRHTLAALLKQRYQGSPMHPAENCGLRNHLFNLRLSGGGWRRGWGGLLVIETHSGSRSHEGEKNRYLNSTEGVRGESGGKKQTYPTFTWSWPQGSYTLCRKPNSDPWARSPHAAPPRHCCLCPVWHLLTTDPCLTQFYWSDLSILTERGSYRG